jgi:signal peptidase II
MVRLGLVVAAVILVADQATKLWILDLMQPPRRIEVTGFFNLVLVWNPGVSFGLFGSGASAWQPWLLSAFATIVAGGLVYWLYTGQHTRGPALGIGLIVGGAIGNVIDRVRFGAVVDFVDLHAGGWHWPAFNVADSAIVVGVGLLLLDAFLRRDGESA